MTRAPSIEHQIRLVAIVGGLLFLALTTALFFVERQLSASQTELADNVVPSQRSLGDLSGSVGAMFLRQSEVVGASSQRLRQLGDSSSLEIRLRRQVAEIQALLHGAGMRDQPDFPVEDASGVVRDVDAFLASDARLYLEAVELRALETRFANRVTDTEATLRRLSERAGGVAGVLRLEYVTALRQIAGLSQAGAGQSKLVHQFILGTTRTERRAIDRLASLVQGLGALVGKVGLATDQDTIALVGDDLARTRSQLHDAISELEVLVALPTEPGLAADRAGSNRARYGLTGAEIAQRVHALDRLVDDLLRGAGDGTWAESLVGLRSRVLAQDQRVVETHRIAAAAASRLDTSLAALRAFAQAVAQRARASASTTIATTRLVTAVLLIGGLLACLVVGIRIRSSVVALRAQNHQLEALSAELVQTNAGLEDSVAARTASLQLVLDSTGDGLIAVALDGTILPERSRAVTDWFGPPPDAAKIWDYLWPDDAGYRDAFHLGFEQLASDCLPFEIAASQLPPRAVRDGRTLALQLREVQAHGKLARVLVTVQDISAQLEAERIEADAREFHHLVGSLLKDLHGFRHIVDECGALVAEAAHATDAVLARRLLHTIKGNCAIAGFERVAAYVHALEGELAIDDRGPSRAECEALAALWAQSLDRIAEYLQHGHDQRQVDVRHQDLVEITNLARRGAGRNTLLSILETWQAEPTSAMLDRLAAQARNLAAQLTKQLRVTTEHNRLRVPAERLRPFWAVLVHIIRNAVDHGIEPAEERLAAGKPVVGSMALSTRSVDGDLVVEIRDDGRGIDWNAVRAKAAALGQATATRSDLVEALFCDGLSTRDHATTLSGRGVGLGAVRATCRAIGGEVFVDSEPGQGTRFQFRFPWRVLGQPPRSERRAA